MKKVLLTTSALTLLAGAAAADVSLGGYARIGISNSTATVAATGKKVGTQNYLRNQITFTGSATSDGGLTLSTWTRYRQSASASEFAGTGAFSAPRLSISNGALTLTAGNAGGAINNNAGIWGCGAIMWGCDDIVGGFDWASTSSTGTGPNVIRLDMALGSASVSVSGGNGNDSEVAMSLPMGGGSVAVGYDAGSATAAVAAADAVAAATGSVSGSGTAAVYVAGNSYTAAVDAVAAAAAKPTIHMGYSGSMAGLSVGLRASQSDSKTGYVGSVTAPVGAGSVYVFAGKNLAQNNVYGLRYNQSLGGSVAMQAGMTSNNGDTKVGAGVNFSF
jgi:outer membrane protein OmpU